MKSLRIAAAKATLGLASAALCLGATVAHAQLMDSLKGALGGGGSNGSQGSSMLGGLGGQLGMPSLDSVGTGNITGVLGYCMKNNYLGGDASSLQGKLLGQLGGQAKAEADPGYAEGLRGILGGSSGQKKMDLNGGGLKQQITTKVCDQVLKYGQSLL